MSKLKDTINYHLSDDYACTRVWQAWQVGTMSEDDFIPLAETERAEEIAQDIKDLIRELMADTIEEILAKDSTSASDYINILQKKVEEL